MGDQWEARVSAVENTQEKLEHNIRKMERQLARLTSLFEDMAVHPRGPSPLPNLRVPRPFIQTTSHLPRGTNRPNLRQPTPTAPPSFVAMSRPINQPSNSRGKPNGSERVKVRAIFFLCFSHVNLSTSTDFMNFSFKNSREYLNIYIFKAVSKFKRSNFEILTFRKVCIFLKKILTQFLSIQIHITYRYSKYLNTKNRVYKMKKI